MNAPTDDPQAELARLRADGLFRALSHPQRLDGMQVLRNGRTLVNFASNDYLGLSVHPLVVDAMVEGAKRYGAGSTASRLVCGGSPAHLALENALAAAKGTEAALTFSSGYAAAIGCIPAVVGKDDVVVLDKLSHACLVDAARASGAKLRVFPHNRVDRLETLLAGSRMERPRARILVITESVFSMDGDVCPLREIVECCDAHEAMLWLDEAHAIGVLGPRGLGLAREVGVAGRVAFQMGTLGKALGVSGGYLAASRAWVELMVNRSRSFIYSTAPPPASALAALRALEISQSAEGEALRGRLRSHLSSAGYPSHPSAILPVVLGANDAALAASASLAELGFLVPAIRYPTVPRGTARLRVSFSAAHDPEAVLRLARALAPFR